MAGRGLDAKYRRRRWIAFALLLASVVCAVLFWRMFHAEHQDTLESLLERDLAALSISWQAVQALQHNSVTTYFEEYVQQPQTMALLQAAQDPDQIDQARLALFRHLSPAYERMVDRGIRQFHFHRPNSDSFLRFHHPARFGDSLLDVRESIRRVNSELEPVFGFEVGRVVSGYRSVFPIVNDAGTHLGSVELSMPFSVLQEELQALLPSHSIQLLFHADRQRAILFDEQQSLYETWPASADFLIEDPHGLRADSPPPLSPEIHRLIERLGSQQELLARMEQGREQAFRLKVDGRDYSVLTVPVFDPAATEVGIVVSYVPTPAFAAIDQRLLVQLGGTWLALLVLALFLYFMLVALDEKLRERARLSAITNTIGQGLYLTDNAGRIIDANPFAEELLGFSEDEMRGRSAHDLFHRHHHNQFAPSEDCPIIQAVQDNREYRDETVFQHADSHLFEVMVVSRPLLLRGRVAGAVTVFEDIRERKQAERALRERDLRLRKLGAEMPGFVYQYLLRKDGSSAFVYASDGIHDIYAVRPEQVETDATAVFAVLHPDDLEAVAETIDVSNRDLSPWHAIYRVNHPQKGLLWVEGHATPERLDDGNTLWHGYIHDVTEREQARHELENSEAKYRTLVEHAPVVIYRAEVSPPWRMQHVSRGSERVTGYASKKFLSGQLHWVDLVHPDDLERLEKIVADAVRRQKSFEVEYRIVHADGRVRWVHETGALQSYAPSRGGVCLQGIITDITQQKQDQLQLQRSAHYDALTGLPNRVLLADRLEQAMARASRSDQMLAVIFIDLDNFKPINDAHGHATGDALLVGVAERMRACLRGSDTLARLGGDEFVAVLCDLPHADDARPLVQRLLDAVSEPLDIGGLGLRVTGSLGVTFYPQEGSPDADQLLRQADQAMYQSKVLGRDTWQVFDLERDANVRGRHAAVDRFAEALANEELVLHYQPQVNLRSGQVVGVEALVRWQHPERGLLMPGEFLPVIDRTEVDIALGQWVLRSALEQRCRWAEAGLELSVAINLSPHCLQQADFLDCVDGILADYPGLPPGAIEFEILESSALLNLQGVSSLVDACAKRGIQFALDDFGTGYSSLSYLKRLPVAKLKVDRCFIGDLEHDVDDLSILEGVLGLGRAFQLEVIAEGVETVGQGRLLLQLGCERAQGFGIARPMPAAEVSDWIQRWRSDSSWQRARVLERREYPLLYALIAAQMGLRTLSQGQANAELIKLVQPSVLAHVRRVLDQRASWPRHEACLSVLEQVHLYLQQLLEGAREGARSETDATVAAAEMQVLRERLAQALDQIN